LHGGQMADPGRTRKAALSWRRSREDRTMLTTPGFHHLHLNSVDPNAAIDWYTRQFPSCTKGEWAGFPALLSPNNVMVLFTKVDRPPPTAPQSAIWHFGWHVTDVRQSLAAFRERPEVALLPLYTTDEGGSVLVSSDTWPNVGGVLGLTRAQIAEARAGNVQPPGGGGFAYMAGPDNALVEYAGNYPAERFNHVHLWQEEPLRALLWYQRPSARCRAAPIAPGRRSIARGCSGPRARAWSSATLC
jgi:hypothetical protein